MVRQRDEKGRFVSVKAETKGVGFNGYWTPIGGSRMGGGMGTYDIYGSQPEPTARDMVGAFEDISYSCTTLIANHVALIKPRLYATTEQGQGSPQSRTKRIPSLEEKRLRESYRSKTRKAVQVHEVIDHPLLDLLEKPNPHQNFHMLIGCTEVYLELTGSAFWNLVRNPLGEIKEIWLLPSHCVSIEVDNKGNITEYKYAPLNGGEVESKNPRDIIHFRFFNPFDPYTSFGVSPVRSVWQRIQILRQELTSVQSILTNMAYPSAIIAPPDDEIWNDLQVERVAKEVEERFRFGNQGGVWVQQDPLKYQVVQAPPTDLAALTIYNQLKEQICNAFHIPKALLDMTASEFTSNNELRRAFQMDCLKPRVIRLLETLTFAFCGDRMFFATDEVVEPDETFELNKALQLWQGDIITQNEARALQGKEPVAGGERFHFQIAGQMGTLPTLNRSIKSVTSLPDSSDLAVVLQRTFREFASRLLGGTKGLKTKGTIPFEDWTKELADNLFPVLKAYYEEGSGNILAGLTGDLKPLPVNELYKAVSRASLVLADSTLRTTELEVEAAKEAVREAIRAGLDNNSANRELADRIKAIFTDLSERRCFLIAETESSRAKHEGELLTIQENGLEAKKVWLADNMACPKCSVLDGESKELNEPFHVEGTGPYAVTQAPPRHPSCRCGLTYDIKEMEE